MNITFQENRYWTGSFLGDVGIDVWSDGEYGEKRSTERGDLSQNRKTYKLIHSVFIRPKDKLAFNFSSCFIFQLLDIAHRVICRVDISESELCITFASMVYECKNKHGLITYSEEYLPNQALKVR